MQLPQSKARQFYVEQIKIIEASIKEATSDRQNETLLARAQSRLDALAEKYQYSKEIGTARYKLYELQALMHYFSHNDDEALDFIIQAIEIRGATYIKAEKLKSQLLHKHQGESPTNTDNEPPLELQAHIRGLRSGAIIMAILAIISIYFLPWAIFYIILAIKLKPHQVPNRRLIKAAAIATLPLCIGLIPILIDIEFWKVNKKLLEYDELGVKAFISDNEYSSAQSKHKKGKSIAWSITLAVLIILIIFIVVAIAANSQSNQGSSYQTPVELASRGAQEAKANTALPYAVDSITTLTDITSDENTIQYHYLIHDTDTSNLSDSSLRGSIQPTVCANTSTKALLNRGVDMQYIYSVENASGQYSFTVTQNDC